MIVTSKTLQVDTGEADTELFQLKADAANNAFIIGAEADNHTTLRMHEFGGTSEDDYFQIQVLENGETEIRTTDDGGTDAHLRIIADGTIELEPAVEVLIDKNINSTSAGTNRGLYIDFDRIGTVSTGDDRNYGLNINATTTGASGGTINTTGANIIVVGDTGGTSTVTGLNISTTGADRNNGIVVKNSNGPGHDFLNYSADNTADYFQSKLLLMVQLPLLQ